MAKIYSAAISTRPGRTNRGLKMRNSFWRLGWTGAMKKFHVFAAVGTIHIGPFHGPRAVGTFVTIARDQIKTHRRQRNHYQSDQRMHCATLMRFLGEAFLQRVIQGANVHMMPFRHQREERMQLGVIDTRELFLNLANHPSLSTIKQLELAAKIIDRANLLDKVAGLVRRGPAQPAQVRRELARIVAFVVADFLKELPRARARAPYRSIRGEPCRLRAPPRREY